MIDEEDNPSIQFKMSLGGPKSLRKVDGPSLYFIDFYVTALTSRLNSTETSLQVSENVTIFADFFTRARVTLRLAVYHQSDRLGAESLETHGQNFFSQLNTCGHSPYIISSLTRGWVCPLELLLALASEFILRSQSRWTREHILLSQIRDFSFCRLLRLAGSRWRYSNPPPHGNSKSKLCYDQRFSRPVCLGIKHPSGAYDQIFITVRQLQSC
jgi:hypothetical protein